MFNVLIVEDEMLVSIGLRNMIDWSGMGMKVIAEASNGAAALEIYEREKPDLILTDIKMPVMDGLQLISKIRENDKSTKIIILTCFQEYDLLHQALQLGVSDYILKMKMSTDEINKVIKKVHDELENEEKIRVGLVPDQLDVICQKRKYIKDFILFQNYSADEFEKIASRTRMKLKPERLALCLMKFQYNKRISDDAKHENSILDAILNIIEELFGKYGRGEISYIGDHSFILLFSFSDQSSDHDSAVLLRGILDRISEIMKTYINSEAVYGISSFRNGYSSCSILYSEAVSALKQVFFAGDTGYVFYGDPVNNDSFMLITEAFRNDIADMPDLDRTYRKEIIDRLDELEKMYCVPESDILESFIRLIHWPAVNLNTFQKGTSSLALEYAVQISSCITFKNMIKVFEQYLREILRIREDVKLVSREVSEALEYISENYMENITLQKVSSHVNISPNYLCSLFRKELEQSFINCVNQIRVEKAKELLFGTHLKIYEVSQKVGFEDESYFSRIFKKVTGSRPCEFKKQSAVDTQIYLGGKSTRYDN